MVCLWCKGKGNLAVSLSGDVRTGVATARVRRWFSTWGILVGYCTLIFVLSSQPDLTVPEVVPSADKLVHFLEYAGVGWLWTRAVRADRPRWTALTVLLSTLTFAGVYGLSDEWHQLYIPGRFVDLHDFLADVCGGSSGGIGYLLWLRFRETR